MLSRDQLRTGLRGGDPRAADKPRADRGVEEVVDLEGEGLVALVCVDTMMVNAEERGLR